MNSKEAHQALRDLEVYIDTLERRVNIAELDSVYTLDLSGRLWNLLTAHCGWYLRDDDDPPTIGELEDWIRSVGLSRLTHYRNFGRKSLRDLIIGLEDKGIDLSDLPDYQWAKYPPK